MSETQSNAVELAVILRTVPNASFVLLTSLIFGLVQRNILKPEDARDIVNNAIQNAALQLEDIPDEAARAAVLAGITDILNDFLEHPLIRSEPTP